MEAFKRVWQMEVVQLTKALIMLKGDELWAPQDSED